jgi:hypothetical protein
VLFRGVENCRRDHYFNTTAGLDQYCLSVFALPIPEPRELSLVDLSSWVSGYSLAALFSRLGLARLPLANCHRLQRDSRPHLASVSRVLSDKERQTVG